MPAIGVKCKANCAPSCMQIVKNEWLRVYVTHGTVLPQNYIHWKSCEVVYTQPKPMCLRRQDIISETNILGGENLWPPTGCSTIPDIAVPVPRNVIHDICPSVSPTHISSPTKPESHLHWSFQLLPLLPSSSMWAIQRWDVLNLMKYNKAIVIVKSTLIFDVGLAKWPAKCLSSMVMVFQKPMALEQCQTRSERLGHAEASNNMW
jgi:hypothetical protein